MGSTAMPRGRRAMEARPEVRVSMGVGREWSCVAVVVVLVLVVAVEIVLVVVGENAHVDGDWDSSSSKSVNGLFGCFIMVMMMMTLYNTKEIQRNKNNNGSFFSGRYLPFQVNFIL